MFIEKQPVEQINQYKKLLSLIGSLSKLFSDSKEPFLAYRTTENIFCKAFNASNHSRSDISADASLNTIGFGIKTFLKGNQNTFQKIAEFNADHNLFSHLNDRDKILKIAQLRNERLLATQRILNINQIIYHCLTRSEAQIEIFESACDLVQVGDISKISKRKSSIFFEDGLQEYSFNLSKSTLFRRFPTITPLEIVPVTILMDPYEALNCLLKPKQVYQKNAVKVGSIVLPLYSHKGKIKFVHTKSGLNQWNASGRSRSPNEIYIPIPAIVNRHFLGFLPSREQSFNLILPNGETIIAKVCQSGDKALMSNPNSALGQWLLREVLELKEDELLEYDRLQTIGLDSVIISKFRDEENNIEYTIDFAKLGTYEEFIKSLNNYV